VTEALVHSLPETKTPGDHGPFFAGKCRWFIGRRARVAGRPSSVSATGQARQSTKMRQPARLSATNVSAFLVRKRLRHDRPGAVEPDPGRWSNSPERVARKRHPRGLTARPTGSWPPLRLPSQIIEGGGRRVRSPLRAQAATVLIPRKFFFFFFSTAPRYCRNLDAMRIGVSRPRRHPRPRHSPPLSVQYGFDDAPESRSSASQPIRQADDREGQQRAAILVDLIGGANRAGRL